MSDTPTATYIRHLAQQHLVTYQTRLPNILAEHITRLSGDEVQLDGVEKLLIALQSGRPAQPPRHDQSSSVVSPRNRSVTFDPVAILKLKAILRSIERYGKPRRLIAQALRQVTDNAHQLPLAVV